MPRWYGSRVEEVKQEPERYLEYCIFNEKLCLGPPVLPQVLRGSAVVRSAMDVYQIALTIDGVEAIMISEDSIQRFEDMSFPQLPGIKSPSSQSRRVVRLPLHEHK